MKRENDRKKSGFNLEFLKMISDGTFKVSGTQITANRLICQYLPNYQNVMK